MDPPKYNDSAAATEKKIASEEGQHSGDEVRDDTASLQSGEDILGMQDMDPALTMKMHLVNNVSYSPVSYDIVRCASAMS